MENTNTILQQLPYKVDLPDGKSWVKVYPTLPKELQMDETTFQRIWNLHPDDYTIVKIYGKDIKTPRWQKSFGQSYYYSGYLHKASPITDPFLLLILGTIQQDSKQPYQQMLINWYQDGQHYIGWHSDDERQLIPNSAIYSFSYGQARDFDIKSKDGTFKQRFKLNGNSLIVMGGEMQKYYKHSVPKRATSTCPGPRINITLRLFSSV